MALKICLRLKQGLLCIPCRYFFHPPLKFKQREAQRRRRDKRDKETTMGKIPPLPHELHEWVQIQVGQEGELIWIGGLYSPDGKKQLRYEHVHIATCPTLEEAIEIGKAIAQQASVARLIRGLPYSCEFAVQPEE